MNAVAGEPPLLFAPGESRRIAEAIAQAMGVPLAPLEERRFEQGEFKLRPLCSVRERPVCVIQSLADSQDASTPARLLRLLFLLCTLRDGGANRLQALVPYLAFARKDRRTQPRDPTHTRYVAQLLESCGLQRLICLDVHNPAALDNAYRIHVDHLSALPMFAAHFSRIFGDSEVTVASPDVGGIKRAQLFGELLAAHSRHGVPLAFVEKRRSGGQLSVGRAAGDVAGRRLILVDDLCSTGGTLRRAAAVLREAGAIEVHVAVTHAPLASGLAEVAADPAITSVTVTDSVGLATAPQPSPTGPEAARLPRVLPIAPLLAESIARPLRGQPLTDLLQYWPPR